MGEWVISAGIPTHETLLSNEKEQTTDAPSDMGASQKYALSEDVRIKRLHTAMACTCRSGEGDIIGTSSRSEVAEGLGVGWD